MTSWMPYLWKEFRQSRRFGLAALGVFLGIGIIPSIIGRLHVDNGRYDDDSLRMVIEFGGPFLAVLAGVYAMGREQGAIEQFWRSRPVNLTRWLVSKYVVGLAIVWLACWVPLLIWTILVKTVSTADGSLGGLPNVVLVYSFLLLLIFSASLVLGQYIRGTLHAAILSVGAMALILIMPLVVRPLNWLSIELLHRADFGVLNARSFLAFAAGATLLSIALLWLSAILLKRGIHADADQRTLSWSVVAILLVLIAGVAFPMGTNLPAQQVIPLPITQDGMVYRLATHGDDTLVLLSSRAEPENAKGRKLGLVRVRVGEQASIADEPLWFADPGQEQGLYYSGLDLAWPAENPAIAYAIVKRTVLQDRTIREHATTLCTIALDARQSIAPVIHQVDLDPLLGDENAGAAACLYQEQLYVYSEYPKLRVLVFSLADPKAPSLVRSEDLERRIGYAGPELYRSVARQYQIQLIPIADLDEPARLSVTYRLDSFSSWVPVGGERILAYARDPGGAAMQLALLKADVAQNNVVPLHPVAYRRTGAVERLLGLSYGGQLHCSGPLAYRLSGMLGVTAYDVSLPGRIERIGHYAAGEGFSTMALLPNNRVVIAGQRLHVLDLSDKVSH
jgi:hypothetical protein